jgi:riboflavin kinase/FMN adenylyltransferase
MARLLDWKAAIIQHFSAQMVVTHGSPSGVPKRSAWSIGNFDGVHRGHREMLRRVGVQARQLGVPACALTFEPHPREFFAPDKAPARIARLRDKLEMLAESGMDRVHVARFGAGLAAMPPQRFVEDFLLAGLGMCWLLVGRDFRFGAKRAGDFAMLESLAGKLGFVAEAMPDVTDGGLRVSSSAVREALAAGDLGLAERLLGRPYTISGRVAHGAKLGRTLGFPTANLVLRRAPPVAGIFVVEAQDEASGERWQGVASVGRRPTVNEVVMPLLEVHLFGTSAEMYGRHLRVKFLARLRSEEKFADLARLREAIARDVAMTKEWFSTHG